VGEKEDKPHITFTWYTPDEGTLKIPHKIISVLGRIK
jgi:hypothetical protein